MSSNQHTKPTVAVVFGGHSNEHDVSPVSYTHLNDLLHKWGGLCARHSPPIYNFQSILNKAVYHLSLIHV